LQRVTTASRYKDFNVDFVIKSSSVGAQWYNNNNNNNQSFQSSSQPHRHY